MSDSPVPWLVIALRVGLAYHAPYSPLDYNLNRGTQPDYPVGTALFAMVETKYKGGGENLSKVVAHLRDGKLVKGYFEAVVGSAEQLLRQKAPSLPREIPVRPAEAKSAMQIPLESMKALFFVKTFEGRQNYSDIKFFKGQPAIEGLWVGVKFFDGERTEGIVHNSIHYLMEPGFFLKPPDPNSNNELMYVLKTSLTEFRVLAVTTTY